jgi:hypothetical protein
MPWNGRAANYTVAGNKTLIRRQQHSMGCCITRRMGKQTQTEEAHRHMRGRQGLLNYITPVPNYNPLKQALPDMRGDKATRPLHTNRTMVAFFSATTFRLAGHYMVTKVYKVTSDFSSRCGDCSCFFFYFLPTKCNKGDCVLLLHISRLRVTAIHL